MEQIDKFGSTGSSVPTSPAEADTNARRRADTGMAAGATDPTRDTAAEALYSRLAAIAGPDNIQRNAPMNENTTFKVGGPADILVKPKTTQSAAEIIAAAAASHIPCIVIGNGSNLLAGDKGFRGVVIRLGSDFSNIKITETTITAQAGALMSNIGKAALEAGLTGFEFATGIPGSIGGGAYMNAGAYGGELKDVLTSALVVRADGSIARINAADMDLSYRHSAFMKNGDIILEVTLELQPGDKNEIAEKIKDLNTKRSDKQPLNYPSAGSTFKRPEGHFAGKLIQDAGLMGRSVGGAAVSEKHAGFIINKGGATAADIKALIEQVQDEVYRKFNVKLEPEVIMIGEF